MSVHTASTAALCRASRHVVSNPVKPGPAVFRQADDLPVHEVRQHREELLRLAPVNLVRAQIPGTAARTLGVPFAEERVLRAPGCPPTDAVPHRRMRRWHRLTVHPDLLAQAPRDTRLRFGEPDPLGANATVATPHAPLRIHQRDRMRRPGQIIPRANARRSHATRPTPTPTARVPPGTAALEPERQPAGGRVGVTLGCHDAKPGQAQNPRTVARRSPPVLPCCWHIKKG